MHDNDDYIASDDDALPVCIECGNEHARFAPNGEPEARCSACYIAYMEGKYTA